MKKTSLLTLSFVATLLLSIAPSLSAAPSIEAQASSTKAPIEKEETAFSVEVIPEKVFLAMQGKSYKEGCPVAPEQLRLVRVLHKTRDGKTLTGELVVNRLIAKDVLEIFQALFKANYPIEKIRLIDYYNADDETSMRDNNTSAFNFRFISGTKRVSNHGLGLAIDINPLYNPYVKTLNGRTRIEPATGAPYVDREKVFPYKIDHNDLCYKLFTERGFVWGGDWKNRKDYQHFEAPNAKLIPLKKTLSNQTAKH